MRLAAAAGSSSFLFAALLVACVRLSAATQRPRMGRRHQFGCRRVDGAAIGGRDGLARTWTDARPSARPRSVPAASPQAIGGYFGSDEGLDRLGLSELSEGEVGVLWGR